MGNLDLFFGSTRVNTPKGISVSSSIFAGLMVIINTLTDRQTQIDL